MKDADLILIIKKNSQIFILEKCKSDFFFFLNRPDFYLEKMQIRFYIKNRADFYLKKCRSDFILKTGQIFIWFLLKKKHMADFYLEKCRSDFIIKNKANFYSEKCRSSFTLKRNKEKTKKKYRYES